MPKAAKPLLVTAGSKQHASSGTAKKRKRVALVSEKENMTLLRWQKVVEAIAHGADRKEAAKKAGISKRTIDAYLISNVSAHSQLRDAQLLHLRRAWPTEKVEKLLVRIALGDTLPIAAEKLNIKRKELGGLYRLLLQDKAMRKWYDDARVLQAETFADQIIDIADDSGNDRLENGRINHEVVNRSKIRVDTRKWLMGSYVKRRFGDHKHVEHSGDINVNHAVILSGGRKRVEMMHAKRTGQAPKKVEPGTVTIEGEAQTA